MKGSTTVSVRRETREREAKTKKYEMFEARSRSRSRGILFSIKVKVVRSISRERGCPSSRS